MENTTGKEIVENSAEYYTEEQLGIILGLERYELRKIAHLIYPLEIKTTKKTFRFFEVRNLEKYKEILSII